MDDFWSGIGVDLHLEPDSGDGRRVGLERALRDAVRDGRLAPGTRLPPTRRLATELGVSRGTAKAAYDQLVANHEAAARNTAIVTTIVGVVILYITNRMTRSQHHRG